MEKQNVTLSLPKDILHRAKIIAVEQNTSLSNLLTQALTEIVTSTDKYAVAQERHLSYLQNAADLGSQGQPSWAREDLHER